MFNSKYINLSAWCLMSISGFSTAHAAIESPRISVQDYSYDAGTVSSGGLLTIDATALSVTPVSEPDYTINEDFQLSADFSGNIGTAYTFINGELSIGTLLSATFENLTVTSISSTVAAFSSDLNFTAGSLVAGLTSGRLEGVFNGISGSLNGDFTVTDTFLDVGAISTVPLPAAIWMFFPMLAGIIGLAKYRKD